MQTRACFRTQRNLPRVLFPAALAAATLLSAGAQKRSIDLKGYENKKRLLLIFAPNPRDARFAVQNRSIQQRMSGLKERDMLLYQLFEKGPSQAGGKSLSAADASALRAQYHVEAGQFKLILIGKDTHTALSSVKPIPITRVFQAIDVMPMRREEMRARGQRP